MHNLIHLIVIFCAISRPSLQLPVEPSDKNTSEELLDDQLTFKIKDYIGDDAKTPSKIPIARTLIAGQDELSPEVKLQKPDLEESPPDLDHEISVVKLNGNSNDLKSQQIVLVYDLPEDLENSYQKITASLNRTIDEAKEIKTPTEEPGNGDSVAKPTETNKQNRSV